MVCTGVDWGGGGMQLAGQECFPALELVESCKVVTPAR